MLFPKVRAAYFALLVLLAASAICVAQEPAIPKPAGYVSDTAGIMGEWAARTEKLCGDIERQTTAEVAVLTVKTTVPLDAQQYAQQVFDRWKIGKKGKDNGVLILVAADDRKMWIATGYGVEGVLPDGKVGEIRDRVLRPLFRQSRYGEGIFMGVKAVGSVLGFGTADMPKETRKRKKFPFPLDLVIFLAVGAFLLIRGILSSVFGIGRRHRGAGYYGGFGGGGFGGGGGEFGGGGATGRW